MKISNEDIHKCRTDLLFYVTQLFKLEKNTEFDINWHHAVLAQALEKVVGGKIKRLILNLPPRYSKTELAVVGFITWCFGNIENSKFLQHFLHIRSCK